MHLRFNFDACPMHSRSGFVHLTHQNLSACALFCLNSNANVNTQLLIYNHAMLLTSKYKLCVSYFRTFQMPKQWLFFDKYVVLVTQICINNTININFCLTKPFSVTQFTKGVVTTPANLQTKPPDTSSRYHSMDLFFPYIPNRYKHPMHDVRINIAEPKNKRFSVKKIVQNLISPGFWLIKEENYIFNIYSKPFQNGDSEFSQG